MIVQGLAREAARMWAIVFVGAAAFAAVAAASPGAPSEQFFARLQSLCGKSFGGRLVSTEAADADFAGKVLVMGKVECGRDEIAIPFAVGENRSRTWRLTRSGEGLRLEHVHKHHDGSEDEVSRYGGETATPGTASRQEFPADDFSKRLFAANKLERSLTNVWAVEIVPGRLFAYELRRPGRYFRIEFDLSRQR
jgi:hypothetical protein